MTFELCSTLNLGTEVELTYSTSFLDVLILRILKMK